MKSTIGRIATLLILSVLVLVGAFQIPSFPAEYLIGNFGYFAIFTITGICFWTLKKAIEWPSIRSGWNRDRCVLLFGLLLLSLITWSVEGMDFKIVMDEPLLISVSSSMHLDRLALYPGRGLSLEGAYQYLDGIVDKRPLLYPFLVSILHDLTGFRISNGFWLNALLVPLFWLLVIQLGTRLGGGSRGGWYAALCVMTVPLVPHLANSGGFDFLSITLVLSALYWSFKWYEHPEESKYLSALVITLVLISNTRYEGPYWIVPFGIVIAFGWWRRRQVEIPIVVMFSPLMMLLPLIHQQVRVELGNVWQVGAFNRKEPFSLAYMGDNLEGAVSYFFGLASGRTGTNSYLVAIAGLAAILTIISLMVNRFWIKKTYSESERNANVLGGIWLLGLGGLFIFLMTFNWGYFDDYITARLSLPFLVGLGLIIPWAMSRSLKMYSIAFVFTGIAGLFIHLEAFDDVALWERGIYFILTSLALIGIFGWGILRDRLEWKWYFALGLIYFWIISFSRMQVHSYTDAYTPKIEVNHLLDFVDTRANENILMVSPYPFVTALKRVPSISIGALSDNIPFFERRLKEERSYDAVYVYQILKKDGDKGDWIPQHGTDLETYFEVELVESYALTVFREARVLKISGIKDTDMLNAETNP